MNRSGVSRLNSVPLLFTAALAPTVPRMAYEETVYGSCPYWVCEYVDGYERSSLVAACEGFNLAAAIYDMKLVTTRWPASVVLQHRSRIIRNSRDDSTRPAAMPSPADPEPLTGVFPKPWRLMHSRSEGGYYILDARRRVICRFPGYRGPSGPPDIPSDLEAMFFAEAIAKLSKREEPK